MRFMIVVKATADSEAELTPAPEEELLAAMATYHEDLAKAGVLVDAAGLRPSREGWRIRYSGDQRSFTDGPFAETKELIAGYTIIRVESRQEAIDWSMRFPNPAGRGNPSEIEVRGFWELEDFAPSESIDRFQALEAAQQG